MSEVLFVLSAGALAGVIYCGGHSIMLWWYRRKARIRWEHTLREHHRTARAWWVTEKEDQ